MVALVIFAWCHHHLTDIVISVLLEIVVMTAKFIVQQRLRRIVNELTSVNWNDGLPTCLFSGNRHSIELGKR